MQLRTLQWNIGGGRIRKVDAAPKDPSSYQYKDLGYIAKTIKKISPDIITLQEMHVGKTNQAEKLAKATGLKYWIADPYDDSHIESGEKLSLGIISKYPLENHSFKMFFNPKYELVVNGKKCTTHDKGVTSVIAKIGNLEIGIKTLHLIPWRKCDVDPTGEKASETIADIDKKLTSKKEYLLIQGDFNFNKTSISRFVPNIFSDGAKEILNEEPTTPKGRCYDHIIYRGFELKSFSMDKGALTDHFPLISEFEISKKQS